MLERFRKKLQNCPSKSELEETNKSLIYKNFELVNTIEQLQLKISELQEYYFDLLTLNNEILAKLNKYQSTSSLDCNDFKKVLKIEDSNCSEIYLDSLTSRIVALDENEELKKINEITSQYYPVPITEDNNNVVIRYHQYDQSLGKMTKNLIPWKERLTINGERYYLVIESHEDERVWEITLMRYLQAAMPPLYKLKAFTDKGEEFENNEAIANGDTQSISVLIELQEGEGLKFEVYPEPEDYDYLASRIFWFY